MSSCPSIETEEDQEEPEGWEEGVAALRRHQAEQDLAEVLEGLGAEEPN